MLLLLELVLFFTCAVFFKMCKLTAHPFEIVIFLIAVLFTASVTVAPDVDNYMIVYTSKYINVKDAGFSTIMKLTRSIGLTFYEFKALYLFVCVLFLFVGLKLILSNTWSVYIFYFLFPFLLNVVQIRNFFAISVVLFAFALCAHLKHKIFLYSVWIVLILIASGQHLIALVFLPFVFFRDDDKTLFNMMKIMCVMSLFFQFFQQFSFSTVMQKTLLLFDSSSRVEEFSNRQSHYGALLLMIENLGFLYIAQKILFINGLANHFGGNRVFVKSNGHFPKYIRNFFLYGSLFWPLYIWGGSFARLMQFEIILAFVLIASLFQMFFYIPDSLKKKFNMSDILAKVIIVFSFLFIINFHTIWITLWNDMVVPMFSNLCFLHAYQIKM